MAEAGFAKTPWYVGGNGRDVLWFDPALDRCKVIATVAGYVQSEGSVFDETRTARLIAAAPDGYALAQMIVKRACTEELSTHVEVSLDPTDAALILHAAEKLLTKAQSGEPQ